MTRFDRLTQTVGKAGATEVSFVRGSVTAPKGFAARRANDRTHSCDAA